MVVEIRSGVHHAEDFHEPAHAIEAAELLAQRGEDREADLARSSFAALEIEVASDDAGDERFVRAQRAVPGDVGERADDDERLVNRDGFGCGREFEAELFEALQRKDVPALKSRTKKLDAKTRAALLLLPELYGGADVLALAERKLPRSRDIATALATLRALDRKSTRLNSSHRT